jgi:sensor domain CHASE-containing protein
MTHEKNDMLGEIADIPPLPADLYGCIDRAIRRRARVEKTFFAFAASIVLLVGAVALVSTNRSRSEVPLQPEVASELQIIHDYLNASDLEGDMKLYAVVEDY